MNNAQFRKIFLDTPRADHEQDSSKSAAETPAAASLLGSRQRPAVPMTPRSVFTHVDFRRQLAEQRAEQKAAHEPPAKKFKSSAAPLGTKLPQGYVDRSGLRENMGIDREVAEAEERLQRLIELAKDPSTGEVDMAAVIEQSKALGGDVKSTHLVKGLDFALLDRVRKGENVVAEVLGKKKKEEDREREEEDLEKELDSALEKVVAPVEKQHKEKKKGEMAQRKTREELLAELKKAKQAAVSTVPVAPVSALGSKFKKIGESKPTKKKKQETKQKKKKNHSNEQETERKSAPLGMIVPKPFEQASRESDEDMDIFEGVGTYDPLSGIQGSSDDSSDDDTSEGETEVKKKAHTEREEKAIDNKLSAEEILEDFPSSLPPKPPIEPPNKPKKPNYFNENLSEEEETYKPPTSASALLAQNPNLAAALAKAAKLAGPLTSGSASSNEQEREMEKKKLELTRNMERDVMDLDLGFGGTRDWGDEDDDEIAEPSKGAKKKRKRGGKKKQGDKNDPELVSRLAKEKYGKG